MKRKMENIVETWTLERYKICHVSWNWIGMDRFARCIRCGWYFCCSPFPTELPIANWRNIFRYLLPQWFNYCFESVNNYNWRRNISISSTCCVRRMNAITNWNIAIVAIFLFDAKNNFFFSILKCSGWGFDIRYI